MFRFGQGNSAIEMNNTNDFYDAVADHYHLFYRNWEATLDREGATLRRLLGARNVRSVFDASCGPGTQAIALARLGFDVTAADLSETMLAKARENAAVYAPAGKLHYLHAGFLDLPNRVHSTFDAVLTKGNALPHLLTDGEITLALRNFHALLKPGGTLIVGIRDFDILLEDRPRFVPSQFHDDPNEQHILFDIWDWDDGPPVIVTFNKFLVSGIGEDYRVQKKSVRYRALRRAELEALLIATGFTDITVGQQQWELVFTATKG